MSDTHDVATGPTLDVGSLTARLVGDGWTLTSWSNGPGDRYAAHEHAYDKVLVVASGTIRFGLPATRGFVDVGPGDRLDLPAGTRHDALVGPTGVTCVEGHRPAGALPRTARHPAATW